MSLSVRLRLGISRATTASATTSSFCRRTSALNIVTLTHGRRQASARLRPFSSLSSSHTNFRALARGFGIGESGIGKSSISTRTRRWFSSSTRLWMGKTSKAKAKSKRKAKSTATSPSSLSPSATSISSGNPNITSTTTMSTTIGTDPATDYITDALDTLSLGTMTTTIGADSAVNSIANDLDALSLGDAAALPRSDPDHTLVSSLLELATASSKTKNRNKKLVTSSVYSYPYDPSVKIRSWKLNEYRYYDVPSPFPTLARGLFTTWVSEDPKSEEGDTKGRHRIVARGYDKFFNIGEVPWCTWAALESHTKPPYVMTLKSNGCIIFIAALTSTKLLVTSKHSLGPVQGSEASHAEMGERWLVKQLDKKGKTTEELAGVLWRKNWTAVAELCDDSFEEHVLAYAPEKTGLHLHGINESTGAFHTLPSDEVAAFAKEWGLIETPFHTVNSIAEVRAFSDEVAKKGEWNGEAIEGFVVRCHVAIGSQNKKGEDEERGTRRDRDAPPYPPGSSFFFKVKYDEPYMTYRDWREITKLLLSKKGEEAPIPKSKLRRPESHLYLKWVKEEIRRDRKAFKDYTKGKGIISTRERFLGWMREHHPGMLNSSLSPVGDGNNAKREFDEDEDRNLTTKDLEETAKSTKIFGKKTIIVPVAIPGCGKTTLAVALAKLFGFGHVQSDDIPGKPKEFIKRVKKELDRKDVVIADKNNHRIQHRTALRDAVADIDPPVRLLAFYWPIALHPPAMVHRICSDRILQRGKNHQTLRPSDEDVAHHEGAVWMFIEQNEELTDGEVDEVVEMPLEDDGGDGGGMQESLARAVDACVRVLGLPRPSEEQVGMALAHARGYKVPEEKVKESEEKQLKEREKEKGKGKKKEGKVRYYALLPEMDLRTVIEAQFHELEAKGKEVPAEIKELWEEIKEAKRVTPVPHITLVHFNNLNDNESEKALWDACRALSSHPNSPSPLFTLQLRHLVSDGRLLTFTVNDIQPYKPANPDEDVEDEETREEARKFVESELGEHLKRRLHVTVGTREDSVKAFEARDVVERWRKGGKVGVKVVELGDVKVRGRVKGMMQ